MNNYYRQILYFICIVILYLLKELTLFEAGMLITLETISVSLYNIALNSTIKIHKE